MLYNHRRRRSNQLTPSLRRAFPSGDSVHIHKRGPRVCRRCWLRWRVSLARIRPRRPRLGRVSSPVSGARLAHPVLLWGIWATCLLIIREFAKVKAGRGGSIWHVEHQTSTIDGIRARVSGPFDSWKSVNRVKANGEKKQIWYDL